MAGPAAVIMRAFTTIPFFRIIIPFLMGIVVAINFAPAVVPLFYFGCIVAVSALFVFLKKTGSWTKNTQMLLADVFLFLFGMSLVSQAIERRAPGHYSRLTAPGKQAKMVVVIDDLPVEKAKTFKFSVRVLQVKTGNSFKKASGRLIVYARKSSAAKALKAGDVILLRSSLREIAGPQNPNEYDYRAYLANRQVFHTAFVDTQAFVLLRAGDYLNPIWAKGLACKHDVLSQLKSGGLTATAYAICAALLTGYDDEIDKNVMEAFSHSGTLHVLSVSGLHTGLIYLVLGFLFDLLDRRKKYKLLKFTFITLVLWFFALITGFSSPVLRAVLMFNLLGFGKIYFRQDSRNQMNILLASAFFLLVYNPFYITDVGFQLSYFALAGLILFQAPFSSLWHPGPYLLKTTWQSVCASAAATVSTLPLTLLYFKQFPLWFFVCNLVVVPATFLLLLLALFVVLHVGVAAVVINYAVGFLVEFIDLFNSPRYGFIDMINFTVPDALSLSALIVGASVAIRQRSFMASKMTLFILVSWQLISLLQSYVQMNLRLLTVYQVKHTNAISIKNKTALTLNNINQQDFRFHVKPHLVSFSGINRHQNDFNYVSFGPEITLILDHAGCWPVGDLSKVTTLVLCNNFVVEPAHLKRLPSLRRIVTAGTNNQFTVKNHRELSRKFGIAFYDTGANGAFLLDLP